MHIDDCIGLISFQTWSHWKSINLNHSILLLWNISLQNKSNFLSLRFFFYHWDTFKSVIVILIWWLIGFHNKSSYFFKNRKKSLHFLSQGEDSCQRMYGFCFKLSIFMRFFSLSWLFSVLFVFLFQWPSVILYIYIFLSINFLLHWYHVQLK